MKLNASFIIFYQYDHDDRKRNLDILIKYISKNFSEVEIVVIQQLRNLEDAKNIPKSLNQKNVTHSVMGDMTEHFNKLQGYNLGVKLAKYNNLIFNDVDIIFNPKAILDSINQIEEDHDKIIQPYDGYVYGLRLSSIDSFEESLDFNLLLDFIGDYDKFQIRTENEHVRLKNIGSTGGGLICKRNTLKKVFGFNPNFKGWGFEDNETKIRFNKLGFPFINLDRKNPMVHIEHRGAKRSSAELPHFYDNKSEQDKITQMTHSQLIEYCSKWNI